MESEFAATDVSAGCDTVAMPRFWNDSRKLRVLGMGSALPGPAVTTGELLERVELRFGIDVRRRANALASRLGIERRHLCRDMERRHEAPRPGHSNPDLAADAVLAALEQARLKPSDVSYLIGHTASPARQVPPNVAFVADRLGFAGPYMELRQACTGFANAIVIAQGIAATPGSGPIAIVGSETGSVYFDPLRAGEDPSQLLNLLQMGDGAAAIILASDDREPGARISDNFFGHIGLGRMPAFSLAAGGSEHPFVEGGALEFEHDFVAVRSNGPELFRCGAETARACGNPADAVDYVVPHQANGRMAELLAPYLGIPERKVFVDAGRVGNLGSAAIWFALAELRSGLEPGARVLALGAEATKYMFGGFVYVHG